MAAYDERAELAPRDIVARAIHRQLAKDEGAFLDAREAIGAEFPNAFPTVFAACMARGVDPRIQPIPVAPAAHYHMGGVATDAFGATSLEGLFAAGECACTGVHGANRLASNSLLEAAVFGRRAGAAAREALTFKGAPEPAEPSPELPGPALQQLRRAMSRDAGVIRDRAGLTRLLDEVDQLRARNGSAPALITAELVVSAALDRTESRGGHFRSDFPQTAVAGHRTFATFTETDSHRLRGAAE